MLLVGCATPETVIRQTTQDIPVPPVADTVYVSHYDTLLVSGEKVVRTDTVIVVKYFPVEKKFYVKVKPDTIRITHTDTTQVVKQEVIETPLLSKVGLVGIGLILGFGLVYVVRKFI
jgi:hypothetical protein